MQLKLVMLRVHLEFVIEVRETIKGQFRHRWPEKRKVLSSLLEGSVPLTKKLRRLRPS